MSGVPGEFIQCGHCKRVNRGAARYCLRCGWKLDSEPDGALPAQPLKGVFRDKSRSRLLRDLQMYGEANLWCGDQRFVYLHMTEAGSDVLYRLDTVALGKATDDVTGVAERLVGDVPRAADLIAPLFATRHGVFCVTQNGVVWFRAHGGATGFKPFERHAWQAPSGETIVGASADASGGMWLAVRRPPGRLSLRHGNGQSSEWAEVAVFDDFDLAEDDGAVMAVVRNEAAASVGVAAEGKTAFFSVKGGAPLVRRIDRLAKIPQLLLDRVRICGMPSIALSSWLPAEAGRPKEPRRSERAIVPIQAPGGLLGTAVLETSASGANIDDVDPSVRPVCSGWDGLGRVVVVLPQRVVVVGQGEKRASPADTAQRYGTRDAPKAFAAGAAGAAIAVVQKDNRSNVAGLQILGNSDSGLDSSLFSTHADSTLLSIVPLIRNEKGVFQPSQFLPPLTTSAGFYLFGRAEYPTLVYCPLT